MWKILRIFFYFFFFQSSVFSFQFKRLPEMTIRCTSLVPS